MATALLKDYLGFENARNKRNAAVYTALIRAAFPGQIAVLIGHHLTFELDGDLQTENEIPSADTLIFDHEVMGRTFGARALPLMRKLAALPCDQRDKMLADAIADVGRVLRRTYAAEAS